MIYNNTLLIISGYNKIFIKRMFNNLIYLNRLEDIKVITDDETIEDPDYEIIFLDIVKDVEECSILQTSLKITGNVMRDYDIITDYLDKIILKDKKKIILSIVGGERCGKDTFADNLVEVLDKHYITNEIFRWSDPIKDQLVKLGLANNKEHLDTMKNEELSIKFGKKTYKTREFIKLYSKTIRDDQDDYFLDIILDKIARSIQDVIIIPDTRFEIEADALSNIYDVELYSIEFNSNIKGCNQDDNQYEINRIETNAIFNNQESDKAIQLEAVKTFCKKYDII